MEPKTKNRYFSFPCTTELYKKKYEKDQFTVVERVYITQNFFAKFLGPSTFVRS